MLVHASELGVGKLGVGTPTPPSPLPQASVPLPPEPKGAGPHACGRGESQFQRLKKTLSTLSTKPVLKRGYKFLSRSLIINCGLPYIFSKNLFSRLKSEITSSRIWTRIPTQIANDIGDKKAFSHFSLDIARDTHNRDRENSSIGGAQGPLKILEGNFFAKPSVTVIDVWSRRGTNGLEFKYENTISNPPYFPGH